MHPCACTCVCKHRNNTGQALVPGTPSGQDAAAQSPAEALVPPNPKAPSLSCLRSRPQDQLFPRQGPELLVLELGMEGTQRIF